MLLNLFEVLSRNVLTSIYKWCTITIEIEPNEFSKGDKMMFKKFIQRIIDCKNQEEAWNEVFYGENGIDMAFQREKITWKEHQMLTALIEKMA